MRHGVDNVSEATLEMAEVEGQEGAHASYCFREKTFDAGLMRAIRGMGHEVSFHHEALSEYLNRRPWLLLPCFRERISDIIEECVVKLRRDIEWFRMECARNGVESSICTMAAHGAFANRLFGVSNDSVSLALSEKEKNDLVEVYSARVMEMIDVRISDCALWKREEWRGGLSPRKALELLPGRAMLLTHPEHWKIGVRYRVTWLLRGTLARLGGRFR